MFKISRFSIGDFQILSLEGVLDSTSQVKESLNQVLAQTFPSLVIDAGRLAVTPEGVELWIQAVNQVLSHIPLYYLDSQLSMILDYDDRYIHLQTQFLDHYTSSSLNPGTTAEIFESALKSLTSAQVDEITAKKILTQILGPIRDSK